MSKIIPALILMLGVLAPGFVHAAPAQEKCERLVGLHDLATTVAIGDYYLKQQSLLAARAYLRKLGQTQNLGAEWTPDNVYWKQAEGAIVQKLGRGLRRDFSSMEWLSEEWTQMNAAEFSDQDIDALLAHFSSDVGRKQAMIVDHQIAFHVMASLSMAGKIQENLAGTEADRKRMQLLYNAEDDRMRFDSNSNPEGTQFAFSPVGKKYFVNAVLKVSGLVSRRLYQMAAGLPGQVESAAGEIDPMIAAYRQARSNRS